MKWLMISASLLLASVNSARAWSYEGHRAVNLLALRALPDTFPAFVREPVATERIAFLSGEPDRWRNVSDASLSHQNGLDHHIDFEDLDRVDIAALELPAFRNVFSASIGVALEKHPERFPQPDETQNKDHVQEFVGHLPWSTAEAYARLKSAFSYLKAYEQAGTPEEVANAKENVIYTMGVLGHYVGDGAQPLHTTRHYNGWDGENPHGYTTARTFHAWIDEGFLRDTGGIQIDDLASRLRAAQLLVLPQNSRPDPLFRTILAYLLEQHGKMEPLYQLEKDGKLTPGHPESAEGRAFLETQLLRGAEMLASLWFTAWRDAPPDKYLIGKLAERKLQRPSD